MLVYGHYKVNNYQATFKQSAKRNLMVYSTQA